MNPGLGFHAVRGGIDPEDHHHSRPRFVGVVDVWKDYRSGDGTISRPGGAKRWLYEPQVGVSTPCGAALTRGTTMFVSSMLELYMYGRIYDPRTAPCSPRVSLALRIGVSTPCGAIRTRGTTVFVPGLLDL